MRRRQLRDADRAPMAPRERVEQLERELDRLDAERYRLYRQYRREVSSIFNERQKDRYDAFCEREVRRPVGPPRYRPYDR
jgi:hypothetical protein